MRLFSKKRKDTTLPGNLLDRVGEAAAAIQVALQDKGLTDVENLDEYIWENTSFVLATLSETGTISEDAAIALYKQMSELYPIDQYPKRIESKFWMSSAYVFYLKQVNLMLNGKHELPDVIIYNLTHPVKFGKKNFEDLSLFEMDFFQISSAWSLISDIMWKYFFRKDEDISRLPLGISDKKETTNLSVFDKLSIGATIDFIGLRMRMADGSQKLIPERYTVKERGHFFVLFVDKDGVEHEMSIEDFNDFYSRIGRPGIKQPVNPVSNP